MRLDKLLANLKFGSRKAIKKLIKEGKVKVNEEIIYDNGFHVDEIHDEIKINDELIHYQQYLYLMLNKPQEVISATQDHYHKTVVDLLDEKYRVYDVYPCGRLDIDTEGLLILSNDGQFAHKLTSPKKEVYKKYYVEVEKPLSHDDIKMFKDGLMILDGNNQEYETKKALLEIIESFKAYVYLSEGKFHQVKRMFEKVNNKVTFLKRVSIGSLELDKSLTLGDVKELTEEELKLLFINENKLEEF